MVGWVQFQHKVGSSSSSVLIHVEMLDVENVQQQEALGILGVNLIHACFFHHDNYSNFVESLLHCLNRNRILIDMINVMSAFNDVDSRLFPLNLFRKDFVMPSCLIKVGLLRSADAIYKRISSWREGLIDLPLMSIWIC